MNNNCGKNFWSDRIAHRIVGCGLLAALTLAASGIAFAQDMPQDKQDKKEERVS